jgi:nicotinate-nucleotide adenylyltransferase
MARVGIFSGTFDPVHAGHVAFCRAAFASAGLDSIVLLPEAEPRAKTSVTPLAHRVAMLELALRDEPQLSLLQLPDARFTVATTLPKLLAQFAGDTLALLLGSDVVPSLIAGWPGIEQLLASMELVIGIRSGDDPQMVERQLRQVQAAHSGVRLIYKVVAGRHAHATSFRIRAEHQVAIDLAPPVAGYIVSHQLYAAAAQ